MPNAELPQFQNPDIIGAYLRGRAAPGQAQLQQQQLIQGQQGLQQQGLQIDQLRQMMAVKQKYFDRAQDGDNQAGPVQTSGQTAGAPDAPWGPGAVLGINVPHSDLSNQALKDLSVAMGATPLEAETQGAELQAKQMTAQKEHAAMQVLDPTRQGNHIPFLIQLNNMPNGAAQALINNAAYLQQWPQVAPTVGVDPADLFSQKPGVADYAVRKVAYALALPSLSQVGKEGLIKAPEHFTEKQNRYGEPIQVNDSTGQESAAPGYTAPGFTIKDSYDAATGHNVGQLVQTSGSRGGGMGSAGAGSGGGGGQRMAGSSAPGTIDLGMDKPTVDNQKAAKFASMFQTGVSKMRSLETGGYDFTPKARGVILDAATNEGGLDRFVPGSAIFKQWLIKNQLSAKDQEYMAALMPALQAAGHSLGGARLTTSQIRSLYESILPVAGSSQGARDQVNANRDSMYHGLLAESGSAAYAPEYNDTLGADRRTISNNQGGKGEMVTLRKDGRTIHVPQNLVAKAKSQGFS